MLQGAPALTSIGDPSFDSVFVSYPEFGVYAISQGQPSLVLSNSQAKTLLNPSTSDYQTLLTSDNMKSFFEMYDKKQYVEMMQRFSFTSYEQIDLFYSYLNNLIKVFLNQGGPTENSAFGALVERTIN